MLLWDWGTVSFLSVSDPSLVLGSGVGLLAMLLCVGYWSYSSLAWVSKQKESDQVT